MQKSSSYIYDSDLEASQDILDGNPAGYLGTGPAPKTDDGPTKLEKILGTAADVGNVFSEIDKVVNPSSYPAVQTQYQTQQKPTPYQQAGFGWGKIILLTAAAGGAVYAGKKFYEEKK
jgi:hypothetical protein